MGSGGMNTNMNINSSKIRNLVAVKVIFHEYSGEDNQEMNMVLYGCRTVGSKGYCLEGEEMASILSNSRHPQTLAVCLRFRFCVIGRATQESSLTSSFSAFVSNIQSSLQVTEKMESEQFSSPINSPTKV